MMDVDAQLAAILAAVAETPDEDTPRLMLADWLEEHDDRRGEFIRLQCQYARLPASDPLRGTLEARIRELLEEVATPWEGTPPRQLVVLFDRGLPWVHAHADTLISETGHAWWKEHQPWIMGLTLHGGGESALARLVQFDLLSRLPVLDLGMPATGRMELSQLMELPRLTRLLLSPARLHGSVATLGGLFLLRFFELLHRTVSDHELELLQNLPRLRGLRLMLTGITDENVVQLARLRQLQSLDLSCNRLTDRSVSALAELRQLTFLDVSASGITPIGRALLREALPRCRVVP